jgi:predicted nucleic acid-binding protein
LVYFDAAFIAKCYLNEPNAHLVRRFAYQADGLASCEVARVEFYSVLHRHLREGNINSQEVQAVLRDFVQDEADGVWQWFPITSPLVRKVCEDISALPSSAFLRAVDAVHLACAADHGFSEIYTNDHHMLDCAQYFNLKGINLIPQRV